MANELGVPEGGIFTAKEPKDSDYDVMSGFPRYTSATPGWYQNWTITAEEEGDYVLTWWDSGGEDSDATPMGRMMKEAYIDDVKAWDDDVGDTTGTNTTDEDETGTEVFSLEVGEKLTIGLSIVDSFGSTDYLAQFRLTAPSGTIVDLGEGDYASGIDDWGTETMYDCTVAYYTSYDYRDECLRELVAP